MLYIINVDIKDASRIDIFAQQLSIVGEYMSFMPKCFFLKTNSESSRSDIYKQLKAVLGDGDLLLIAETNLKYLNGWLSNSVVEWLKNT